LVEIKMFVTRNQFLNCKMEILQPCNVQTQLILTTILKPISKVSLDTCSCYPLRFYSLQDCLEEKEVKELARAVVFSITRSSKHLGQNLLHMHCNFDTSRLMLR
jgi:hypothetical protein